MKKMRKLAAVLCAALLMFSACGEKEEEHASAEDQDYEIDEDIFDLDVQSELIFEEEPLIVGE